MLVDLKHGVTKKYLKPKNLYFVIRHPCALKEALSRNNSCLLRNIKFTKCSESMNLFVASADSSFSQNNLPMVPRRANCCQLSRGITSEAFLKIKVFPKHSGSEFAKSFLVKSSLRP